MTSLTINQIGHLVKLNFEIPLSQNWLMAYSMRPPNLVQLENALIKKDAYYIQ